MNTEDHERALDAQFAVSEASLITVMGDPVDDSRVPCRVKGCRNDAPRRGPYAGRCKGHQHLTLASLDNGAPPAELITPGGPSRVVLAAHAVDAALVTFQTARVALGERLAELRELTEGLEP